MQLVEGLLIVLIVLIVLMLVGPLVRRKTTCGAGGKRHPAGCRCPACISGGGCRSEGFGGPDLTGARSAQYAALHRELGAMAESGAPSSAANQPHFLAHPGLAQYYSDWAAKPRDVTRAQRAAWFEAVGIGRPSAPFDPETGGDKGRETLAAHKKASPMDYGSYVTDMVVTPRMRAAHKDWVNEVQPFSQGAMAVDDMEEAAVMSLDRTGITAFRNHGAPAQHDPLFITAIQPHELANQFKPFYFNG